MVTTLESLDERFVVCLIVKLSTFKEVSEKSYC